MALRAEQLSVPGRLEHLSLALAEGTMTAVVGPNGSGKSTLLQALAGLLPADGSVQWMDEPMKRLSIPERARRLAWVGQEAHFEFSFMVREVVTQGRYAWGNDDSGVDEALSALDLIHLADRPVTRLSGGERHRVTLARALATQAPIQLWDEPVAQLDVRHALEVLRLARQLAERGFALLVSLHDLRLAQRFDRVMVLDRGRLRGFGAPSEMLNAEVLQSVFGVRAERSMDLVLHLS